MSSPLKGGLVNETMQRGSILTPLWNQIWEATIINAGLSTNEKFMKFAINGCRFILNIIAKIFKKFRSNSEI